MGERLAVPLVLLLLALMVRLAIAIQGIHGTDILFHVNGSKSLLLTGSPYCLAQYNYPPLYSAIQLSSILVFGWNPLGYKFMPILFDSLLSLALYIAVKRFTDSEKLALASQLLWVFNPLAVVTSAWYGLFDSIPTLFVLASLLALISGRATVSALFIALGIVAKVFPALYLLPQALHPRNKSLRDVVLYIAIAVSASLLLWLSLSVKCLDSALRHQLGFHLQRLDKGLSLMPNIQYSTALSLAVSTAILTAIAVQMRRRLISSEKYLALTSTCTVLLVALNPFIYPHYLTWFLPLTLLALVQRLRKRGITISAITTFTLSAIGLTYWKYYRIEVATLVLRIALYAVLTLLILLTITLGQASTSKSRRKNLLTSS